LFGRDTWEMLFLSLIKAVIKNRFQFQIDICNIVPLSATGLKPPS
jgi:hypothetical protein